MYHKIRGIFWSNETRAVTQHVVYEMWAETFERKFVPVYTIICGYRKFADVDGRLYYSPRTRRRVTSNAPSFLACRQQTFPHSIWSSVCLLVSVLNTSVIISDTYLDCPVMRILWIRATYSRYFLKYIAIKHSRTEQFKWNLEWSNNSIWVKGEVLRNWMLILKIQCLYSVL